MLRQARVSCEVLPPQGFQWLARPGVALESLVTDFSGQKIMKNKKGVIRKNPDSRKPFSPKIPSSGQAISNGIFSDEG